MSPVFDDHGRLTHFVGVQADVTARVQAGRTRERAYAAEREARAQAERIQARLLLLAAATAVLTATLDVDTAMERLANLTVPALADGARWSWCRTDLRVPASPGDVYAQGADLLVQADAIRAPPPRPGGCRWRWCWRAASRCSSTTWTTPTCKRVAGRRAARDLPEP